MPRPYTSGVVQSSPESVWAVLREFNGLSDWMPAIANSRLTTGSEGAPGAVRHLTLGDGGELDEELLAQRVEVQPRLHRADIGAAGAVVCSSEPLPRRRRRTLCLREPGARGGCGHDGRGADRRR